MKRVSPSIVAIIALVLTASSAHTARLGTIHAADVVVANDNQRSAGVLTGGTLTLRLRAGLGSWRPEGAAGPVLQVEAFGEEGATLQSPAPLIRVPEGTAIVASIRNDLDAPLRVHGLCTKNGSPCATIEVPVSSVREVRFAAGDAGTYHYWATSSGMPIQFRGSTDTQLSGAFVVDAADAAPDADRVLVITEWTSLTRAQLRELAGADDVGVAFRALNPRITFLINGLAWPVTERFTYRLNETVRWRVVNLSTQPHPMHLHGFFFDVVGLGDGTRHTTFAGLDERPRVVTQLIAPGATMQMAWRPERAGNWLFHCHISEHIAPERRLGRAADAPGATNGGHRGHGAHDAAAGMAGMVLGVTVVAPEGWRGDEPELPEGPARKLTLSMRAEGGRHGRPPRFGFVLENGAGGRAATSRVAAPGPTLALRRGEPVEITLVNRLPEATAIHWHGMELDSYYDGVHGWSGAGTRITPLIEPGTSFTVRFTPPRTGTFMYHTHLHNRQLGLGLYGAMIVHRPQDAFDPTLDHVLVIGRDGAGPDAPTVINGERRALLVWKAGARHRVRLINITPGDVLVASLGTAIGPVEWRPLTKDGAAVPAAQAGPRAAAQTIAVGETYDFEYQAPGGRQSLWLNVRTPGGRWEVQAQVVVK